MNILYKKFWLVGLTEFQNSEAICAIFLFFFFIYLFFLCYLFNGTEGIKTKGKSCFF